jgi:segregation and condensation protein B
MEPESIEPAATEVAFAAPAAAIDAWLIRRVIEAALLAAQRPLSLLQLAELFPEEEPVGSEAIAQALEALQAGCAERGVELVEVASGFRYQIRVEMQPWVSRLWAERQVKYTRATLETLALIAYRQPITRGEIEQVRGVAIHSNMIKTLEEREWIRVVGHRDVPGKPALFGTTRTFLDYFGLKSLDQLPPLAELGELVELDPQLPFEPAPTIAAIMHPDDDADASLESIADVANPNQTDSIEAEQMRAHQHDVLDDVSEEPTPIEPPFTVAATAATSNPSDASDFDETEAPGDAPEQTHD